MTPLASWLADYPGLTFDRLIVIADRIRSVRNDAADDHRPESGETNWSLGVRGFERTNSAIVMATLEYPWLAVVHGAAGGPVQFVFSIAGHPIRVCRGDAEDVPTRYKQPCFPELVEKQGVLDLETVPAGRFLRLVVENDAAGRPAVIYLHELDEATGEQVRTLVVPPLASNVAEFVPQPQAVKIPPVVAESTDDTAAATAKKTGSEDE